MATKKQDHKKRLLARKTKIKQDKARAQKYQREFIMDLIKKEQQKGLFDNNPVIGGSGTITEGPSF